MLVPYTYKQCHTRNKNWGTHRGTVHITHSRMLIELCLGLGGPASCPPEKVHFICCGVGFCSTVGHPPAAEEGAVARAVVEPGLREDGRGRLRRRRRHGQRRQRWCRAREIVKRILLRPRLCHPVSSECRVAGERVRGFHLRFGGLTNRCPLP